MYQNSLSSQAMTPTSPIEAVIVNKFLISQAGVYNDMYHRPYEITTDNETMSVLEETLYNAISGVEGTRTKLTPWSITGVASNVAHPTAVPVAKAAIPHGWDTPRLRFILEVEVHVRGHVLVYYVQGYSEHADVSFSGHIDEHMPFYVNSVIEVDRVYNQAYGVQDIVKGTYNLLHDPEYKPGNMSIDNMLYSMCPSDLIRGIETSHMMVGYGDVNEMNFDTVTDTRAIVGNTLKTSNRMNNSPSSYLAQLINSYLVAEDAVMVSNESSDIYQIARSFSGERTATNNFLLRIFMDMGGMERGGAVHFTMADLMELDAATPSKTVLHLSSPNSPIKQGGDYKENSEYWTGSDIETHIATILGSAVPSLMASLLLTEVVFSTTNITPDGKFLTTFIKPPETFGHFDKIQRANMFATRLEHEILTDVTANGLHAINISMDVNLFGDTIMDIDVNNGGPVRFVVPSFCDSLVTPVIAPSKDIYEAAVNDITDVLNTATHANSAVTNPVV